MRQWKSRRALVVALLALTACESDEKKAARLEQRMLADCLGPDLTREGKYHASDDAMAQCDAARHAYNKFLSGR